MTHDKTTQHSTRWHNTTQDSTRKARHNTIEDKTRRKISPTQKIVFSIRRMEQDKARRVEHFLATFVFAFALVVYPFCLVVVSFIIVLSFLSSYVVSFRIVLPCLAWCLYVLSVLPPCHCLCLYFIGVLVLASSGSLSQMPSVCSTVVYTSAEEALAGAGWSRSAFIFSCRLAFEKWVGSFFKP